MQVLGNTLCNLHKAMLATIYNMVDLFPDILLLKKEKRETRLQIGNFHTRLIMRTWDLEKASISQGTDSEIEGSGLKFLLGYINICVKCS